LSIQASLLLLLCSAQLSSTVVEVFSSLCFEVSIVFNVLVAGKMDEDWNEKFFNELSINGMHRA
jgi:hypothetical protein